jgi:hypothetical protein
MEGGTGDPAVAETLIAVARTTNPAEVIQLTAAGTRQVNERQAKAVTILLDSARVDPAAAEMLQVSMRVYRDTLNALAQRLEDLGALEPDDRRRAADVFWYLFGGRLGGPSSSTSAGAGTRPRSGWRGGASRRCSTLKPESRRSFRSLSRSERVVDHAARSSTLGVARKQWGGVARTESR